MQFPLTSVVLAHVNGRKPTGMALSAKLVYLCAGQRNSNALIYIVTSLLALGRAGNNINFEFKPGNKRSL